VGAQYQQKGKHYADEYEDEVQTGGFGEQRGEVAPLELIAVQKRHFSLITRVSELR